MTIPKTIRPKREDESEGDAGGDREGDGKRQTSFFAHVDAQTQMQTQAQVVRWPGRNVGHFVERIPRRLRKLFFGRVGSCC